MYNKHTTVRTTSTSPRGLELKTGNYWPVWLCLFDDIYPKVSPPPPESCPQLTASDRSRLSTTTILLLKALQMNRRHTSARFVQMRLVMPQQKRTQFVRNKDRSQNEVYTQFDTTTKESWKCQTCGQTANISFCSAAKSWRRGEGCDMRAGLLLVLLLQAL